MFNFIHSKATRWLIVSACGLVVAASQSIAQEATATSSTGIPSFRVAEIFTPGDKPFDQVVEVEGFPVSVCKRDGKKAWIRDINPEAKGTLRVECLGDMKPFDQTNVGQTVIVRGILREKRLDASYFDEWEASLAANENAEEPEDVKGGCSGDCGAKASADKTRARITSLRAQLEKSPVGYLSSRWIDGIEWRAVDTTAQR
jgi:hypothetical protein